MVLCLQSFWTANGKCYGFQSVLEDGERGPVGIVYDATSARSNPALAGFISSPEGFEEEVLLTCQFRKHFSLGGDNGSPFCQIEVVF